MLAIASNTQNYELYSSACFSSLAITRLFPGPGFKLKFRSIEYTHKTEIYVGNSAMATAMRLFRNCQKLSFNKNINFTLLEVLIIARDLPNFKRFYRAGTLRAGEGSKAYREHVWKLLVTQPRLLFKTKLPKASHEFVTCVANSIFTPWKRITLANFCDKYIAYRIQLLNALDSSGLPLEIIERIVQFVPHWVPINL